MVRILTLTGPTGSGKAALARMLLENIIGSEMVPTDTTRAPRQSDLPGQYRYVTADRFQDNRYAWSFRRCGDEYGVRIEHVLNALNHIINTGVLILAQEQVEKLHAFMRKHYGTSEQVHSLFLVPPDPTELFQRLKEQGRMTAHQIQSRIFDEQDWEERAHASQLPYQFIPPLSTDEQYERTCSYVAKNIEPAGP